MSIVNCTKIMSGYLCLQRRLSQLSEGIEIIAFFVWAWPSGLAVSLGELLHEEALFGLTGVRKVGVPRGRLFPSGLCLSAIYLE